MNMSFYLSGLGRMLFSLEAQQVRAGEFCQRESRLGGGGLEKYFLEVIWRDMGLA
jgi:hypothetical protein